jgi:hypothetical protein
LPPRTADTLEAVRMVSGGHFDPDMWHVMNERDNTLIADEVAHGAGSPIFVYQFEIGGHPVANLSTKGLQHLAGFYGGLHHKIISALEKRGTVICFQRFAGGDGPPIGYTSLPAELASEPDFYSVVVEVTDIKTGNSVQIERREYRFERRRDGSEFERPHYQTIAQSKARRNGYGVLIPQDVQAEFLQRMLKLDKNKMTLTPSLLAEKRSAVLRYAAANSVPLDRRRLDILTFDQIAGLGDAAREGALPAFVQGAVALGLSMAELTDGEPPPAPEPPRRGRPRKPTEDTKPAEPPADPAEPSGDAEPPEPAPTASGRRALFE